MKMYAFLMLSFFGALLASEKESYQRLVEQKDKSEHTPKQTATSPSSHASNTQTSIPMHSLPQSVPSIPFHLTNVFLVPMSAEQYRTFATSGATASLYLRVSPALKPIQAFTDRNNKPSYVWQTQDQNCPHEILIPMSVPEAQILSRFDKTCCLGGCICKIRKCVYGCFPCSSR